MRNPRVLTQLLGTPWAITHEKHAEILGFIDARLRGGVTINAADMGGEEEIDPEEDTYLIQSRERIALISVMGTLSKRMNMVQAMSGGCCYSEIEAQVRAAAADSEIDAIFLHIDSPGGNAIGVADTAAAIREAAAIKPVIAYTDGHCCSGAYWLASGATEIHAAEDAIIGSIGVCITLYDQTAFNEQLGLKVEHIYKGQYKVAGDPHRALTAEDRKYFEGLADDVYTRFVATLAANRNMTQAQVLPLADGRVHPAAAAKELGLIDKISTYQAALAAAKGAVTVDLETLKKNHPEVYNAAAAEGATAATTAERARVAALIEVGGDAATLVSAINSGKDAGGYAIEVLKAERANPPAKAEKTPDLPKLGAEVPEGGTPKEPVGPASFVAAVDALVKDKGMDRDKAVFAARKEHPALYAEFMKKGNSK